MLTRLVNLHVPAGGDAVRQAEILIDGEHILRLDAVGAESSPEEERVDLGGCLVLPGVIDGHVHFDDPGFTWREDFATGTAAAAAGGVTVVADMPCTSLPPVTNVWALERKLEAIGPRARVDFMLWGGASADAMAIPGWRQDFQALLESGVAAVKTYLLSGMETFHDITPLQLEEVLRVAGESAVPVGVHAEDRELVERLTAERLARDASAPADYAASRPPAAEFRAVHDVVRHCRATGAAAHIVHLASAEGLDVVASARREGLPITAETCPHYLAFTTDDLERIGSLLKTAPPVHAATDRDALWRGLADGTLSFVASDHAAGRWPDEKRTGSIWSDYGGVPGVELTLPFLYSEGVRSGRLTLERLVEVTASAPADFFGLSGRKGRLAPAHDADLVVLDPEERWTVTAEGLHNLNRYTPFEGRTLTGRVRETWLRGRRVFRRDPHDREELAPPGGGRFVRRNLP